MYHPLIPLSVFSLPLLLSHLTCGTNTAFSSTSIIRALILLQLFEVTLPPHILMKNLMIYCGFAFYRKQTILNVKKMMEVILRVG